MEDLKKAKELLEQDGYTCVLCRDNAVYTSRRRGVQPLMALLDTDVSGFSAADKVVGKATALLYCLLDIRQLYAKVISDAAIQVLEAHGIPASWDSRVAYIINREGTGRCPMELATEHISDPKLAPDVIREKLKSLCASDKES